MWEMRHGPSDSVHEGTLAGFHSRVDEDFVPRLVGNGKCVRLQRIVYGGFANFGLP